MVPGSVGFQCPECVSRGMKETRQNELPHGGTRSADPRGTSIVLIGINLAVWVAILLTGWSNSRLGNLLALTPAGVCASADEYIPGATAATCTVPGFEWTDGVASGAFWQVVTSGFAHVGITHIGFNMLVLWMLGPTMEQRLGRARYLAVYLVALLGGSAAVMLFSDPETSTLGASGAIYGLMGALVVLAVRYKGNVQQILIWLGINVAISFTFPGISWQGHFGGLLGGALVAAILVYLPKDKRSLQWPLVGLVAALFIGLIVTRALQLA